MTMKRWDGGAFVDTSIERRWDGSNWVDLTIAKRWDGSSWVDIAFPGGGGANLSATINPASLFKSALQFEPAPPFKNVVTAAATVTPTGGTGPYTYQWTKVSGDSAIVPSSTTAASVTFSANAPKNQLLTATWQCTVTDSLSATFAVSLPVRILYENGQ